MKRLTPRKKRDRGQTSPYAKYNKKPYKYPSDEAMVKRSASLYAALRPRPKPG